MVDMVPDQLIKAGEELFQLEDDIYQPTYNRLAFDTIEARTTMTDDGLSMGEALGEASAAWMEDRVDPIRTLITNLAEFLVVHSQDMTEIDEFNGTEFDQYSDLVDQPRQNHYTDYAYGN
ncbi:hypothetical protein [Glycomyces xiaoerkulensis]|uniref:hypothetical protein n=1 Tax=Glycomyces xiaoerkulensis TaxID=2038139 RepID=UPI000C2562D4|nr:hypothetical protein [Glycomyces xiaoerkulensis]